MAAPWAVEMFTEIEETHAVGSSRKINNWGVRTACSTRQNINSVCHKTSIAYLSSRQLYNVHVGLPYGTWVPRYQGESCHAMPCDLHASCHHVNPHRNSLTVTNHPMQHTQAASHVWPSTRDTLDAKVTRR